MKLAKTLLFSSIVAAGSFATLGTNAHAAETYTVQAGDTLSAISVKFVGNTSLVNKIASDNQLSNQDYLYVGEQLTIDTSAADQTVDSATTAAVPTEQNTATQAVQTQPVEQATATQAAAPAVQPATTTQQQTPSVDTTATQTQIQSTQPETNDQTQSTANNTQVQSTQTTEQTQPAATQTTTNSATTDSTTATSTNAAKEWIAQKESGGSYTATNGQYIGRYQLSASYLNGDYSEANQEKVADQYVASRYGSWEAAQAFWQANGWY